MTTIKKLVRCGECYGLSDPGAMCSLCGMPLKPNQDITREQLQRKIRGDLND